MASLRQTDTAGLIILGITVLFLISAISGVNRGIKYLSQLNICLMVILFLVFLCFGPFHYLVVTFFQALSDYLQAIIPLSTTLTLFGNKQWTNDWTIFYWAWWISWSPFVGAFIAQDIQRQDHTGIHSLCHDFARVVILSLYHGTWEERRFTCNL